MNARTLKTEIRLLEVTPDFPIQTLLTRVLIDSFCPLLKSEILFGQITPLTNEQRLEYWLDARVKGELEGVFGLGISSASLKLISQQLQMDQEASFNSEQEVCLSTLNVIFESFAGALEKQFALEDFQCELSKGLGLQLNYSISPEQGNFSVCPIETQLGSFKVFFSLKAASQELIEELTGRQTIKESRKIRVYASQLESLYSRIKRIENLEHVWLTGPQVRSQIRSEVKRAKRLLRQMKSEPLETLFVPAYRLVQDMAKEQGKEIKFVTEGTWLTLDKYLLNHLYQPILQLFKNAVDYGIESPRERERKGKPASGTIKTIAAFSENALRVVISDDGVGFNYERIRERAVQLGILTERQSQTLLSEELGELVFHPGFSTHETKELHGSKGFGLDSVKRVISSMGGEVRILSSSSFGTAIELLIPMNDDFSSAPSELNFKDPSLKKEEEEKEEEEKENRHLLVEELTTYLEKLTLTLQAIAKERNLSAVSEAYRTSHQIKGVTGFLNWGRVASFCHHYEEFLKLVTDKKIALDAGQIDLIVEAGVCLKALAESFKESHPFSMFQVRRIESRLLQMIWVSEQNQDREHLFVGTHHLASLKKLLNGDMGSRRMKMTPEFDFQKAIAQPYGTLVQFNGERIGYAGLLMPETTFEKCILPRFTGRKSRVSIKYPIEALAEFGKNMGTTMIESSASGGLSLRALFPLTYFGWGEPLSILGKPTYCYSIEWDGFLFYLVGDFRSSREMTVPWPISKEISAQGQKMLQAAKQHCQTLFEGIGLKLSYRPLAAQSDLVGFEGGVTAMISCLSPLTLEPDMTLFLSCEMGLAKTILERSVKQNLSAEKEKSIDLIDVLNEMSLKIGQRVIDDLSQKGQDLKLFRPSVYTGKASVNHFNQLVATQKIMGMTPEGRFEIQILLTQGSEPTPSQM